MVAFDPLRAVYFKRGVASGAGQEPLDPLGIVEDALLRGGFLGVKVYPPMGFKAIGNTDTQHYPQHVRGHFGGTKELGRDLDDQLARLYDLCVKLDAPIIAHAAYSMGAGPEYAQRADPYYWTKVLSVAKWRKLRVCLAHQGRFRTKSAGAQKTDSSLEKTYEWAIGRHLEKDPQSRLFMDLSYWSEALGSATRDERECIAKRFQEWICRFDPAVERVLFGTDWIMVGVEAGAIGYTRQIDDFLSRSCGLSEEQIAGIMRNNAGRYLGLRSTDMSRQRLESFYTSNGISPGRLPSFG
jgi:predicted TIM-barrel fold metal-dependent hydrolase